MGSPNSLPGAAAPTSAGGQLFLSRVVRVGAGCGQVSTAVGYLVIPDVAEPTRAPCASTCTSFRSGATNHPGPARPRSQADGRRRHSPVVRTAPEPGVALLHAELSLPQTAVLDPTFRGFDKEGADPARLQCRMDCQLPQSADTFLDLVVDAALRYGNICCRADRKVVDLAEPGTLQLRRDAGQVVFGP